MTTLNHVKKLCLFALAGFALATGSAQAHGWDGHHNPYLPISVQIQQPHGVHPAFGEHFERGAPPRQEHAGIDQRQQRQMRRIHDGIASGQLSRHEARDLLREQREIERAQRRYLADGRLSRDEWMHLDRMLDRAAANIREEKHDRNGR